MSLDNFQIPASLVQELYKDSMIALESEQIISDSLNSKKFNYLGSNKKNILILVDNTTELHLPDNQLELLTSILLACKLSIADVIILNINTNKDANIDSLINNFKPKTILLFGIPLNKIHLSFEPSLFENIIYNGHHYIFSTSLQEISNKIEEKKLLWNALKKVITT
jgi:hypothetical protein